MSVGGATGGMLARAAKALQRLTATAAADSLAEYGLTAIAPLPAPQLPVVTEGVLE